MLTHVGHLRSSHFTAISGRHLLTGPYERHLGATLKLICSLRSSICRHTYIHTYKHIHTRTQVRCRARQVQLSESLRHTHAYTHIKRERERDRGRVFFGSSLMVLVVPNSIFGAFRISYCIVAILSLSPSQICLLSLDDSQDY